MTGVRVSEMNIEKMTETAIVTANSLKRLPTEPCINATGTKAAQSTRVVETTAMPTWRDPRRAASKGGSPMCMRRWIFSSMMMASSTTRPMASTIAKRVRMLMENPIGHNTTAVAISEIGTVTAGMSAARTEPRNR